MGSLLGTIQQSVGALGVSQIGLQVVGNNIANANTPGFIRQRLEQSSAIGTREGSLIVGHGVRPTGVVQQVDQQLFERMLSAQTSVSGSDSLLRAYGQLEEITSDLSDRGLNNQLSLFDNALQEWSTAPNDPSLREFVLLQAENLTETIRDNRVDAIARKELYNGNLATAADEVNTIIKRIAKQNIDIATIEGGGSIQSDATGLRDQRYRDLESLAQYININIQEQSTGVINVFVGGDYLISNGIFREVVSSYNPEIGGNEVRIAETDSALSANDGLIGAARAARDEVFGDYIERLDRIASSLIRSVNRVHSQGQGGSGHQQLISTNTTDAGVPLEDAGLPFVPENGTFDIDIVDEFGETLSSHRINVRNLGTVDDSTITSVVADINAIDGLTAIVDASGFVEIRSDAPTASFVFRDDNSGFLAAVGLNTFFTGSSALDIDVNPVLLENSDRLAISKGGIGSDTDTLNELIGIMEEPLDFLGQESVRGLYEQAITGIGQRVALQQSSSEGLGDFYATLQSQHLAVTGVNIDEESIQMISYQRAFQASSRVIATASEMLELLVNL
ncbi:MAG: flagellar hook-associated protein FlgK [Planctomycetota bacterium]